MAPEYPGIAGPPRGCFEAPLIKPGIWQSHCLSAFFSISGALLIIVPVLSTCRFASYGFVLICELLELLCRWWPWDRLCQDLLHKNVDLCGWLAACEAGLLVGMELQGSSLIALDTTGQPSRGGLIIIA